MTPIETIALIFVLLAAIKLIVILSKPGSWMKVVKTVYGNPALLMIVSLILAAVVFYYLLQELTIIQILATMAFTALLAAITAAPYSKEIVAVAQKMLKGRAILKKAWLSLLIWIALIIWALYVLFA